MSNSGLSGKKKSTLIEREAPTKGEASWPAPQHLSNQALQEICEAVGVPKSKRPEFCVDLSAMHNDLVGLIVDMKQRGTNSKHRDDSVKNLKNVDSYIRQLEAQVEYERQRKGRVHLESPVMPILSNAAANFPSMRT